MKAQVATILRLNRRWTPYFSPVLYKGRSAIERMYGRIKDICRIVMRYDRLEPRRVS